MARISAISAYFWDDPDIENLDRDEKLLFLFLFTNNLCGPSGIYKVSLGYIAYKTAIEQEEVRERVAIHGIKNVHYDVNKSVVFVENKLKYRLAGRPDLIAKGIMGDYRMCPYPSRFWGLFRRKYAAYIEAIDSLREHFQNVDIADEFTVDELLEPLDHTELLKALSSTMKAKRAVNYEKEIQVFLKRYEDELDREDRDTFYTVYNYLTSNTRTGKPIRDEGRYSILKKMSTKPALQIVAACYMFIEADCMETKKRFAYFWGIVKKSAAEWYFAWKSEHEKLGYNRPFSLKPKDAEDATRT